MWEPNLDYFPNIEEGLQHSTTADTVQATCSQLHGTSIVNVSEMSEQSLSLVPSLSLAFHPEHYSDLRGRTNTFCDFSTVRGTNSAFSDHIDAVEACLAGQTTQRGMSLVADKKSVTLVRLPGQLELTS